MWALNSMLMASTTPQMHPNDCSTSELNSLMNKLFEQINNFEAAKAKRNTAYFQKLSYDVVTSPLHTALYQVLYDAKQEFDVHNKRPIPNSTLIEREHQLNEMLINENIDPPFAENAIIKSGKRSSSLGEEHNRELRSLRDQCNHILFATYGNAVEMAPRIQSTLQQQCVIRPISLEDVSAMQFNMDKKFAEFRIKIKLETCQAALAICTKFAEKCATKRRNFSKQAVELLNEYYLAISDNPYPNEHVKMELANRTGLTLMQVSNWFGNKRIRNRQKLKKQQQNQSTES